MAAGWFSALAAPARARAISAGTQPGEHVHPEVVQAMREVGIDLSGAVPRKLTIELARQSRVLITMGCGDECPFVPGARIEDWPLPDPKGQPIDVVREIRDEIRRRVDDLIRREGVGRSG
jgi:arsenate reductase